MLENLTAISSTTTLGKIVRYPLRLMPSGIKIPILSGPLRGKRWIVGAYIHRCWIGTYELAMQEAIAREISPATVFYDIGANAGFYSLLAASRGARVFSFEPLPANVRLLKKHLEINRMHDVKVFETAISDQVGTAHFQAEGTRGMGKLELQGNIVVQTSTVDLLLDQGMLEPPQIIKMDIEGAEFCALKGAEKCFKQYRPKLFLATHGRLVHDQCMDLLKAWNYQISPVGKQDGPDRGEVMASPAH